MPFILTAVAALAFASCSMADSNGDYYPEYYVYATISVNGSSYFFTDDSGETYYPGDISRISTYKTTDDDGNSKDGKRVFLRFNKLPEKKDGFDYNIAIYYIEDILSKTVEIAETAAQVAAAGGDPVMIKETAFQGEWFTIVFRLRHSYDAMHKLTLLDNRTATPPSGMPADYQYLEFRQLAKDMDGTGSLADGIVSFKLDDNYHPAETGKKGFYIRIMNLDKTVEYVRIEYKTPTAGAALQQHNTPTPNLDRIW